MSKTTPKRLPIREVLADQVEVGQWIRTHTIDEAIEGWWFECIGVLPRHEGCADLWITRGHECDDSFVEYCKGFVIVCDGDPSTKDPDFSDD